MECRRNGESTRWSGLPNQLVLGGREDKIHLLADTLQSGGNPAANIEIDRNYAKGPKERRGLALSLMVDLPLRLTVRSFSYRRVQSDNSPFHT